MANGDHPEDQSRQRASSGSSDIPHKFPNVPPPPSGNFDHSFTLQAIMELKGSHGSLTQAISGLIDAIGKQERQLGKIDDLRVDVGKLEAIVSGLSGDLKSTKDKLDVVRMWIVGAGAVIAFIAFVTPLALKFWPSSTPPAASSPQPLTLTPPVAGTSMPAPIAPPTVPEKTTNAPK